MFPSKRPVEPTRKGGERLRRRSRVSPQTKLYSPSIYSYMCRGKFYASSETKEGSEGVCKGFKSKLEVLYDASSNENISRAEALRRFTTMASDVDLDHFQEGDSSSSELHQRAKSVLLSPALIYKNSEKKQPFDDEKTVNPITTNDLLPEEELILRQEWSCYGSTEVEYLVLQDVTTGEKKIAAVAPRNTGISIREIETEGTLRKVTRVGLGWLDIIYDNNSIIVDASENEQDEQLEQQRTPEEVPPRPSIDAVETAKQALTRTYDFSKKVAEHMKFNLQWLGSNLQDDFPARTYAAGQSIVAQLPKAVDLTVDTMGKVLNRMFGGDDENDSDRSGRD